jgi:hypothetical protein
MNTDISLVQSFKVLNKYLLGNINSVLPLTRIFPCSKEILVLARNLQGNKIYKEMARKNTKIKGNCKDFCNLSQLQVLNQ